MTNEMKINLIKHTIETLKELKESADKESSAWLNAHLLELSNYYEGKAKAFGFVIECLERDLED